MLAAQLRAGLEALGEDPDSHPCAAYLAYLDLLEKWNGAYNLSGIRQKSQMLTHHLLDSLSLLPYLRGNTALDVGTGAGLPGFVLALARPGMSWILLDSNEKKTRFLWHAQQQLGPSNIEIVRTRVADYRPSSAFANILARALMPAADFCEQTAHLLAEEGRILLMKGREPVAEIRELDTGKYRVVCQRLKVPGVEAERHLLLIERQHQLW